MNRPRIDVLVECISRLALEPGSVWRARELGGDKWFGWGMQASLTADLIDALSFNTAATATNKKARLKNPVERPGGKKVVEHKPKTVADMRWGDALNALKN